MTHSTLTLYDIHAWVVWLISTTILILMARNPLYTILILFAVQIVAAVHGVVVNHAFRISLWRWGVLIVTLSTLFNLISVHVGETVLFALPDSWPLVGGDITAEAAVYGASNGLLLVTLLATFLAFNQIAPVHELIRLVPSSLRDLGIVILIAITYVPETQRHLQKIRQAQAIRGHEVRGWRDWRPLILPLLIGGLERAMGLAEAMVARGYGATAERSQSLKAQLVLVMGLLAGLGGWVSALWIGWPGWLLMGVGVLLVVGIVWWQSRQIAHTDYRQRPWRRIDSALLLMALIPFLFIIVAGGFPAAYSPYPLWQWPPFDLWVGAAVSGIALPAALPPPMHKRKPA
ncbi:MAG: hypothetical protein KDE51_09865 [Anaerolineales bacterium]|nr:hypothetical protein [Anaerolineales bacterium]